MNEPNLPIESASVKVMRSYDYCHFEVCLSVRHQTDGVTIRDVETKDVDELRKTAARLADKAVEQYKAAKANADAFLLDKQVASNKRYLLRQVLEKPEPERTPEDKAQIKAVEELEHRNRPRYDYQDDWEEPDYGDSADGEMF